MGLGMSLVVRQELRVQQRAILVQRASIVYGHLLAAVYEEKYTPEGTCPSCRKRLSKLDILRGFNDSPRDYTTGCPQCHHRFRPQLVVVTTSSKLEIPFYCALQTLDRLRGKEAISPDTLEKEDLATARSAIFHFGSLRFAFRELKVEYTFAVMDESWKQKVRPFLGKLPDKVIASAVGVEDSHVRDYRRSFKIAARGARKEKPEPVEA